VCTKYDSRNTPMFRKQNALDTTKMNEDDFFPIITAKPSHKHTYDFNFEILVRSASRSTLVFPKVCMYSRMYVCMYICMYIYYHYYLCILLCTASRRRVLYEYKYGYTMYKSACNTYMYYHTVRR